MLVSMTMDKLDEVQVKNRLEHLLIHLQPSEEALHAMYCRFQSGDYVKAIAAAYHQGYSAGKNEVVYERPKKD